MTLTLAEKTEIFQRNEIKKLLSKCTEGQQGRFHQLFPNGVPIDKLETAHGLIMRTLEK